MAYGYVFLQKKIWGKYNTFPVQKTNKDDAADQTMRQRQRVHAIRNKIFLPKQNINNFVFLGYSGISWSSLFNSRC